MCEREREGESLVYPKLVRHGLRLRIWGQGVWGKQSLVGDSIFGLPFALVSGPSQAKKPAGQVRRRLSVAAAD